MAKTEKWLNNLAKNISTKCYVRNVRFYILANMFRATLEMLIVLYLVIAWIILTGTFFCGMIERYHAVDIIRIFVMGSTVACIVYIIIYSIAFLRWCHGVIKYDNSFGDKWRGKDNKLHQYYMLIDESFRKRMIKIHAVGVIFYALVAFVIANILCKKFNWAPQTVWLITGYGFVCGVMWNLYGYYTDMRLDWSKIFVFMNGVSISNDKKLHDKKFEYLKRSAIIQFITRMLITGFLLYVAFFIRREFFSRKGIEDLLFYLTWMSVFAAIIMLYIKQMHKMLYSRKYYPEESKTFLLFGDFFISQHRRTNLSGRRRDRRRPL